jgi:choice-of-anchor A domain-containing protein
MRVLVTSLVSVVVLSSAACSPQGPAEPSPIETLQQNLIVMTDAGGDTTKHKEIVRFNANAPNGGNAWICLATLMAPRWLLTASHCVNESAAVPTLAQGCQYNPGVEKIFLFYPDKNRGCTYVEPIAYGDRPDGTGDDDVALVLLKTPNLSVKPASIAPALPSLGDTVSGFGRGDFGMGLRYVDLAFQANSGWLPVGNNIFEGGDSGAPLLLGSGTTDDNDQVWGLNSVNGGLLQFGAVIGLRSQICQDAYSVESHTWDVKGKPLVVPVGGCAPEQSAKDAAMHTHEVITSVCSSRSSCCDPAGTWDATCVANACKAYNSVGCLSPGTATAWTYDTVGTTQQRYPADFNIFALGGDASIPGDVFGAVAASGKVSGTSFALNTIANKPVGLVAGTDVSLSNGTMWGNIYYGGQTKNQSISSGVAQKPAGATVTQGTPIKFGEVGSALVTMSSKLFNAPNQIPATVLNRNITLSSSNPGLNVFLIHQGDFNATHSISLSVPACSTVIINVDGTNPSISSAQISLNGHNVGLVLWNFTWATTLDVSYGRFWGSVLAPGAKATFSWGEMYGTLVAQSVDSTTEFNNVPFGKNCLVPN